MFPKTALLVAALLSVAAAAHAEVTAKDAWVRATVTQQKATGLFVQLTSSTDARLVSVTTPVAGVAEIHEMAMEGNVMKMRAVPGVDLPAGKAVDLKPGGYHVMLMDLRKPLKEGDNVEVTLTIEGKDQKRETLVVKAPVRPLAGKPMADHGTMHHH